MSLSELASLGSFLSGIAVVFSFVFLSVQTRQNTLAVRASASQAHAAEMQQIISPLMLEKDAAHLWRVGCFDIGALSDDDRVRFVMFCAGLFRWFDASLLQWRHGQLDTGHWQSAEAMVRDFIRYPGVQVAWDMRKHWHSSQFQAWVDSFSKAAPEHGLYDLPHFSFGEEKRAEAPAILATNEYCDAGSAATSMRSDIGTAIASLKTARLQNRQRRLADAVTRVATHRRWIRLTNDPDMRRQRK
jgi:hypothetical protein